jgi:hypothetical protein
MLGELFIYVRIRSDDKHIDNSLILTFKYSEKNILFAQICEVLILVQD